MRRLVVTFPFVAQSSKNRRSVYADAGRIFSKPSKLAREQMRRMKAKVRALGIALGQTWAGKNYVAVDVVLDELAGEMRVTVHDLGPQPKRGRCDTVRDVHGVVESVMDGLEKHAFDDDRQVRWCRVGYRGWNLGGSDGGPS